MPNVLIASDLSADGVFEQYFTSPDHPLLDDTLRVRFDAADLRIANLEMALASPDAPYQRKTGPYRHAPPDVLNGVQRMGIDAVSLANNHVFDRGEAGLRQTIDALDMRGIQHAGAGFSLVEAAAPLILSAGGMRIGLLSYSNNEFGLATARHPGTNPLEIPTIPRQVMDAAARVDHLVVLVHAGPMMYQPPSPFMQDLCRMMVDFGAGTVLCQHSHIVGWMETYKGAFISYGQGNFVHAHPGSDPPGWWRKSMLVELQFDDDGAPAGVDRMLTLQNQEAGMVAAMPAERQQAELAELDEQSALCDDAGALQESWLAYCRTRERELFSRLLGPNRWLYRLAKRLPLYRLLRIAPVSRLYGNLIRCPDHSTILRTLFEYWSRAGHLH